MAPLRPRRRAPLRRLPHQISDDDTAPEYLTERIDGHRYLTDTVGYPLHPDGHRYLTDTVGYPLHPDATVTIHPEQEDPL